MGEMDACSDLVEAFGQKQKSSIEDSVERALRTKGLTADGMLRAAHRQAQEHGCAAPTRVSKARFGPYAAPFYRQVGALLKRKVLITLRNPGAVGMQLFMPIGMGFVL